MQFLAGLFICPLLFHRQVLMVSTVQKTDEDPVEIQQVQILDKVVDLAIVEQRQVPMVLTVQMPAEIPQLQILDKVVDMLVCCATTDAHGPDFAVTRSVSAVAVHRQIRRHLCRCCATTDAHGPDFAETRGDSTGLQLHFIDKIRRHPCRVEEADPYCASVHQEAPAETVQGFRDRRASSLPPMFVTAPVLEAPPAPLWSAWSPHPWSRTYMLLPLSRLQ